MSVADRVLADMAEVCGGVRETMCVYAGVLAAVDSASPPSGVRVEVARATEMAYRAPAAGRTPPDASSVGVHDSDFVAVASVADRVVGWTCLRVETPVVVAERGVSMQFEGAYLWRLFVVPSERDRGVGAALVRSAAAFADADRVRCAYALVEADNELSRRLFESVGFEHVESLSGVRLPLVDGYVPSLGGPRSFEGVETDASARQ